MPGSNKQNNCELIWPNKNETHRKFDGLVIRPKNLLLRQVRNARRPKPVLKIAIKIPHLIIATQLLTHNPHLNPLQMLAVQAITMEITWIEYPLLARNILDRSSASSNATT